MESNLESTFESRTYADIPANMIILGLPGSGKTTIGEIIDARSDGAVRYISVGDISRQLPEGDPRREYVDQLYQDENRPTGSPEFFLELLKPEIENAIGDGSGMIIDGMPKKLDEVEPLTDMLEELGIKIDAVIVCEVSPFTALKRVLDRGSREGGLDTIETAINRGDVYTKTINNIVRKIGGFLSAKIVEVDTESMDAEEAATKASEVLEIIRRREAEATVLNIDIEADVLVDSSTDTIARGIETEDSSKIVKGLKNLLIPNINEIPEEVFGIEGLDKSAAERAESIDSHLASRADFVNLPKARRRYAEMLSNGVVESVYHLADVVQKELGLRGETEALEYHKLRKILEEIKICQSALVEHQGKAGDIQGVEEFVNRELEVRSGDIQFIHNYLSEANVIDPSMSVRQLMEVQIKYWDIFTSSEIIGTVDGNYQKLINGIPGEHHSLAPPVIPPRSLLANSIGEYRPFIEAVSTSKRSSFDTSLGFLHVVGVDSRNHAFQVEWPVLMYDSRLAQHENGLLRDMLARGQGIYFNHDLWHNLIPVYAESFNLYHPHAPIAYGGILEPYEEFGKKMRQEKEEYEIMVAKNHANTQKARMAADEGYKDQQVGAVISILNDIPHLRAQLKITDNEDFANDVADYFMTVAVGRLLNIIEPGDPSLDPIITKLDKLNLLNNRVTTTQVAELLFTQRLVLSDNNSRLSFMNLLYEEPTIDDSLRRELIEDLLQTVDSSNSQSTLSERAAELITSNQNLSSLALRFVNLEYDDAESGAQELYKAIGQLGLDKIVNGDEKEVNLSGISTVRWYAITAPQRKPLKGHMEKVHGKTTVKYGGDNVHPAEVLKQQTEAIKKDSDIYEYRRWARDFGQELSKSIYDLLFDDNQPDAYRERSLLTILTNHEMENGQSSKTILAGIIGLDLMLDDLVGARYSVETPEYVDKILRLAERAGAVSQDLHETILDIVKRYRFLSRQETTYQGYDNTDYRRAKENIETSTMGLTS